MLHYSKKVGTRIFYQATKILNNTVWLENIKAYHVKSITHKSSSVEAVGEGVKLEAG